MPKSKGVMVTFYDREGKDYPFFGLDRADCQRRALAWARKRGIRLYARRGS